MKTSTNSYADYMVADGAWHNVMMEHNYREMAEVLRKWLVERGIR